MDDCKNCQKNQMDEKEEKGASVNLPELQPLQLDKDFKERVLQQLVPVRLQHLNIGGASYFCAVLPRAELTRSMMASSQLSPGCWWNKKKSKLMMLESFAESVSARMQLKTTINMEDDGKR